jgi:hypothetical protein
MPPSHDTKRGSNCCRCVQEADISVPPLVSEIDLGFHVEKSIMALQYQFLLPGQVGLLTL